MNAIAKMLPAISTPEAVVPTTQPLHEAVRAAVVLTALEPDVAANVLSGFSDARIRSFARAMTRIGDMQATEINAILHDFMNRLKADGGIAGGEDEARRYLSAFMEPDSIEQMMEEIAAPPPQCMVSPRRCSRCNSFRVAGAGAPPGSRSDAYANFVGKVGAPFGNI